MGKTSRNPNCPGLYRQWKKGYIKLNIYLIVPFDVYVLYKLWNLFHINALYDLENGVYTDVIVQKEHAKNESKALCQMVECSGIADPVILLADRNFEAYNNFACLEKKGWKYLIRIKDRARKNAYGVKLPDQPEF